MEQPFKLHNVKIFKAFSDKMRMWSTKQPAMQEHRVKIKVLSLQKTVKCLWCRDLDISDAKKTIKLFSLKLIPPLGLE